ncbi:DNA-processing protein DprA [Arenicella xantha]|uniref:DNA protecting protein DprA n=1 Tax=Arenicella xantha TaxID=644221 RepID=A0A395JHB1_9GAMM|nr:DNA-processing protein DprA [Arenicella xantha]RBP48835.1 DNA protecting protein DprA [Arenicella xantha]
MKKQSSRDTCRSDWCALIRDRRWSTRQKLILLESIGPPAAVLNAPRSRIQELIGLTKHWHAGRAAARDVERDMDWLSQASHQLIDFWHASFPSALRELPDPPIALFAIGDLTCLNEPKVSIVGSRRPTPVGRRLVASIASDLARLGVVVTSGMALGIDGLAHQAALAENAKSIAILGSGLDRPTPSRHEKLYKQLCETGLVLSEYPIGTHATRYTFPERNRLVSGVSLGVVIVEAAERSGTLITARLAMEQNREVMVLPGSALSAQYAGSHRLIQQGAGLVLDGQDVLNCLALEIQQSVAASSKTEAAIVRGLPSDCVELLHCIDAAGSTVNDIILESGLTPAEVSSMLITLELAGAVAVGVDGGYVNLS